MSRRKRKPKKQSRFSRKNILLGTAGVFLVGIVAIYLFAANYLTKNYLAYKVEKSFNCRFEIGKINLSLWSSTATISLENVKLAERDSFANEKTPHDERSVLPSAQISVRKIEVKVSMFDVLFRNLDVESIRVEGLDGTVVLKRDGSNDFETLFAKPPDSEKNEKDGGFTFNIFSSSDLVANLRDFELVDSKIKVKVESSDLDVIASGLNVNLLEAFEIDVDKIGEMEPAKFGFSAMVDFYSNNNKMHYGKVEFDGDIEGTVFDAETGDLDPNVDVKLKIGNKSYLKKILVLEKITEAFLGMKKFPLLQRAPQEKWPETYMFEGEKVFHSSFHKNTYTIKSPLKIHLGSWNLRLEPSSHFSTDTNQHQFDYKLVASESHSKVIKGASDLLVKSLPGAIRNTVTKEINTRLYEGNRFVLKFKTTGSLSSPDVQVVTVLPNIGSIKSSLLDDIWNKFKK